MLKYSTHFRRAKNVTLRIPTYHARYHCGIFLPIIYRYHLPCAPNTFPNETKPGLRHNELAQIGSHSVRFPSEAHPTSSTSSPFIWCLYVGFVFCPLSGMHQLVYNAPCPPGNVMSFDAVGARSRLFLMQASYGATRTVLFLTSSSAARKGTPCAVRSSQPGTTRQVKSHRRPPQ